MLVLLAVGEEDLDVAAAGGGAGAFAGGVLGEGLDAELELRRRLPRSAGRSGPGGGEAGFDRGLAWILAPGGIAGHHGFTGTSLYLAPETGRYLVLCTNAVHNGPARTRIAPLRQLALKTLSVA
ncbi:serine hydrolase [Streptomyces laurentii]|uniref:serine hydrolase n=1 Tax=Streptomyces laurentii TaxID=39478 RepID=UPI00367F8793